MSFALSEGTVHKVFAEFGFLSVTKSEEIPVGTELFFHFNNGRKIMVGPASPELAVAFPSVISPRRGDGLLFRVEAGRKGKRAGLWASRLDWDEALYQISTRKYYRMMKRESGGFGKHTRGGETVYWEGFELSGIPRARDSRSFDRAVQYWFEVKIEDNWERCDDPRIRFRVSENGG